MNKPARVVLSALLLSNFALGAIAQDPHAAETAKAPFASVKHQAPINEVLLTMTDDERLYFQHVTALSSPFFEGRAPGLRGNILAAEYVEFFFNQLKLKPAFNTDTGPSMRQSFSTGTEARLAKAEMNVPGLELKRDVDFSVLGSSATGVAANLPIVFAGYAISNADREYTTLPELPTGKDSGTVKSPLEGKIAMILRFEPMNANGRSKWLDDPAAAEWSTSAGIREKISNLTRHKPAAIILVNPPGCDDPRTGRLDDFKNTRLPGVRSQVPLVMMSTSAAEKLVKLAGKDLLSLRKQADEKGFVEEFTNVSATIDVEVTREPITTYNVAATLAGKGNLADQFVVIGAHMDHVGYGQVGSRAGAAGMGKLHPGADDNASGTAGLIMAAAKLKELYDAMPPDAPRRTVLFIGFSGEELGLIGSRAFVKNPSIPLDKVTAMLNMDMIGRVRAVKVDDAGNRKDRVEVAGVGTAEGFKDLVQPLFDKAPLKVETLPGGQGPSDHASFYNAQVPVLHFFSGLHPEYHMPQDFFFTINPVGAMKVVKLVCDTAELLATRPEKLAFSKAKGPSVNMNDPGMESDEKPLSSRVQNADPNAPQDPPRRPRIRFGIAPASYGDDKPGVGVGEVYDKTPAAEAGLKSGDRIIKWNGTDIANVEAWMPLFSQAKPGDEVEITYIRDGETRVTKCKLRARDDDAK